MISSKLLIGALLAGCTSVPDAAKQSVHPVVRHHGITASRARKDPQALPLDRIALANQAAVREPSISNYLNAVQIYSWMEGGLYRLYAAPEAVSDIALQPGEGLISVAAGDTVRWVIGDTTSGSGAAKRTHILIKPSSAGLRTNLVITTDRRVYLVELQSTTGPAMAAVSWTYPKDDLLALKRAGVAAEAATPVASDVALDSLNFDYKIEGDSPPWRPVRVFDDGRQVFIEFPPTLASADAPPLFGIGSSGKAELINYRLHGRFYIVDQLFSQAELRLGEKRQTVVRIVRSGSNRSRHEGAL